MTSVPVSDWCTSGFCRVPFLQAFRHFAQKAERGLFLFSCVTLWICLLVCPFRKTTALAIICKGRGYRTFGSNQPPTIRSILLSCAGGRSSIVILEQDNRINRFRTDGMPYRARGVVPLKAARSGITFGN